MARVSAPGRPAVRLAGQSLRSPAFAQWIGFTAAPLALLGLVWLMFGRTRRKEAEHFTRSVVTMRTEARSLEALLQVLSQRIHDSRTELTMIAQHLMQLGDEATGKLGGITREFDTSAERLRRHGEALDRAAESARNDIGVLLEDLPAPSRRRSRWPSSCVRSALNRRQDERARRTASRRWPSARREADRTISDATDRLAARLAEIDIAGTAAAAHVGDAETAFQGSLDLLLDRTSHSLDEIRSGIDAQAAAVAALVEPGLGGNRQGRRRSGGIARRQHRAGERRDRGTVEPRRRAGPRLAADDRRDRPRTRADRRALHRACGARRRTRQPFPCIAHPRPHRTRHARRRSGDAGQCDRLARRTHRNAASSINRLAGEIRDGVGTMLGEAQGGADRLAASAGAIRPEIDWIRDAAIEAERANFGDRRRRSPSSRTASPPCSRRSTTGSAPRRRRSPSSRR